MFKEAKAASFRQRQPLNQCLSDKRIPAAPFAGMDRLARKIMCSHVSARDKDCEFFFALHKAQSIVDANGHISPFIRVLGGKEIESNGRFNLMLKKHSPLLSRHGLLEGIKLSSEAGSRLENCRILRQNMDAIIKQMSENMLKRFARRKDNDDLISSIAGGLRAIRDIRFKAAFLELYVVASKGVFNGTRHQIRECANQLWKAAEDAEVVKYPKT